MRKTIILFLALLMSALYGYADENKSSLNVNSYLQFKTYFVAPKDRWRNYALVLNRSELAVFWEPNSIVNCLISIGDDEMMLGKSTIPKDVKFDFKASSLFVLSLGIHKLPFSWELLESDTDLDFINRSESVLAFAPYRMIGVQIAGETGFLNMYFVYLIHLQVVIVTVLTMIIINMLMDELFLILLIGFILQFLNFTVFQVLRIIHLNIIWWQVQVN